MIYIAIVYLVSVCIAVLGLVIQVFVEEISTCHSLMVDYVLVLKWIVFRQVKVKKV